MGAVREGDCGSRRCTSARSGPAGARVGSAVRAGSGARTGSRVGSIGADSAAAAAANVEETARYDARNPQAIKRLVAAGTQLRPFPVPVMEACYKAANDMYAEINASNADFKKVYDNMVAFRNDEYLWWQVAEYTYDSFMIRSRSRT